MELVSVIQISRYALSFCWIYHGLFPKLLHVASTEIAMTATLGFSAENSLLVTRLAGASEIIFGLLLFFFYRSRSLILLNMLALVGLLAFVAVQIPSILIDAFNPVTTNIAMLALSAILLNQPRSKT